MKGPLEEQNHGARRTTCGGFDGWFYYVYSLLLWVSATAGEGVGGGKPLGARHCTTSRSHPPGADRRFCTDQVHIIGPFGGSGGGAGSVTANS